MTMRWPTMRVFLTTYNAVGLILVAAAVAGGLYVGASLQVVLATTLVVLNVVLLVNLVMLVVGTITGWYPWRDD